MLNSCCVFLAFESTGSSISRDKRIGYLHRVKKEIDSRISASFTCDASTDYTQKNHEFMLLNVIKENGERDLKSIGIAYVAEGGALGHLVALKASRSM